MFLISKLRFHFSLLPRLIDLLEGILSFTFDPSVLLLYTLTVYLFVFYILLAASQLTISQGQTHLARLATLPIVLFTQYSRTFDYPSKS